MSQPTEPRRTRRAAGWADVPAMEAPLPAYRETPALIATAAILEALSPTQRGRVLRYLADRYGFAIAVSAEVVEERP
jgi:hypothetical protein